jgi:hypothetical protein
MCYLIENSPLSPVPRCPTLKKDRSPKSRSKVRISKITSSRSRRSKIKTPKPKAQNPNYQTSSSHDPERCKYSTRLRQWSILLVRATISRSDRSGNRDLLVFMILSSDNELHEILFDRVPKSSKFEDRLCLLLSPNAGKRLFTPVFYWDDGRIRLFQRFH